ncbi:MAG: ferrous iron transport protein A [Candidatus Sumerlaeia bacterium]|nr:ferrous iron transport protein A [Candidatus Sumerlaeia bacterium]
MSLLASLALSFSPAPVAPVVREVIVPLSKLTCNEEALVLHVETQDREAQRLATLGVVPGAIVRVVCAGRTCLLMVGETRLSVRAEVLERILVERLSA